MFHEMVGDPEKDKAMMEAVSPVMHADKIKTPLFVAQGARSAGKQGRVRSDGRGAEETRAWKWNTW